MATPTEVRSLSAAASMAVTDVLLGQVSGRTLKITPDVLPFLQSGSGASAEPTQTALRRLPFPESYGATGDGATDDTTACQAALTAHTQLTFRTGQTYLITSALVPQSSSRVVIEAGATIKIKTGAAAQTHCFDLTGLSNVTIEGAGILDGNKAGNSTGRALGVQIKNASNITVRGLTIQNMPGSTSSGVNEGDGVYIGGSDAAGSTNVLVEGCRFTGNVRQGISIVKGSRIRVVGNDISGTTGSQPGAGIDIEANSASDILREITIVGNVIQDNEWGVFINNTSPSNSIVISGNTFRNNRQTDILCNGTDVSITSNFIDITAKGSTTGAGVHVYNASNVSIVGNVIVGNYDTDERGGIRINRGANRIAVIGNTIKKTHQPAIDLAPGTAVGTGDSVGITVIGNVMEDCITAGQTAAVIRMQPATASAADLLDVVVTGNTIYDSRSSGNEADLGISLVNTTAAMRKTWRIFNNVITGTTNDITGVTGIDVLSGPLTGRATLNFDLTSAASQDLTISVDGAALGDPVALGVPNGALTADTLFWAWVSATDTVTVRAMRIAGTPDPASGEFVATVFNRHGH